MRLVVLILQNQIGLDIGGVFEEFADGRPYKAR